MQTGKIAIFIGKSLHFPLGLPLAGLSFLRWKRSPFLSVNLSLARDAPLLLENLSLFAGNRKSSPSLAGSMPEKLLSRLSSAHFFLCQHVCLTLQNRLLSCLRPWRSSDLDFGTSTNITLPSKN
jgi:hypothetical protein